MSDFEYKKSKIISVNQIDFKQRYFILDEKIIGSDQGLIATYEDGTIEILFFDCTYPLISYSSESTELINPADDINDIIIEYKKVWDNPLSILKNDLSVLSIDLSLLDGIDF
jgi:hypothetical protein